jgi:hypothetical protein
VRLELVVAGAENADIARTCLTAIAPGLRMIDLAQRRSPTTPGKATGPVASDHEFAESLRDGVHPAAVVELVASERIGDDPAHGRISEEFADDISRYRTRALQLRRPIAQTKEGRQVYDEVHMGPDGGCGDGGGTA